ncbi:helix-turn-helix transcriptional regulator [Paenibacillus wynnii]|uniref:helix-turn-helix transcriptional regulator n=1 Tax=Paenibacillus wynnii TaxID=268407 RepID=UPI00068F6254|nr:helix-turn-helix transcriptional regulator [Paenibacillus wynnii]
MANVENKSTDSRREKALKIMVKDSDKLNSLIIMNGFSKTDFAKEIKISQPTATQITNGERNPSPRTAKRICEVLECEWTELFEIIKYPQISTPGS